MKRLAAILVVCLLLALLLTGCARVSYGGQGQSTAVWSFHGENDEIAVENGVIVISPDTETLYGGNLTVKTEAFDEVAAYTVRIKLDTGEEWRPLLVNTVSTADASSLPLLSFAEKVYCPAVCGKQPASMSAAAAPGAAA